MSAFRPYAGPVTLIDPLAEPTAVKPRLRGWLHLVNAPLTLVAGIVLIALSPTAATRLGSAVFAGSALVLFTVSAIYHRGTWSPRGTRPPTVSSPRAARPVDC